MFHTNDFLLNDLFQRFAFACLDGWLRVCWLTWHQWIPREWTSPHPFYTRDTAWFADAQFEVLILCKTNVWDKISLNGYWNDVYAGTLCSLSGVMGGTDRVSLSAVPTETALAYTLADPIRWTVASFLPNMYICSNTDLSGTGASVLQHRHYQIVSKRLPICDAQSQFSGSYGSATVEFLSFPCAAVRVRAARYCAMIAYGWRTTLKGTLYNEKQTRSVLLSKARLPCRWVGRLDAMVVQAIPPLAYGWWTSKSLRMWTKRKFHRE